MAGTKAGGEKAAETNKKLYGADFYSVVGKLGGSVSAGGGFASNKVGADGLTGKQRAKVAGVKGGQASWRKKHES